MKDLGTAPLRCAYVVSRYPYVSHTFILREIQALRDRGARVDPVTVRRPDSSDVISAADRAEQERTHAILPTSPTVLARAHLRALGASPRAYVGSLAETLGASRAGARATLWQLFYFAEGILLWHWLREHGLTHVHAHHGNVAADLAMVATRFANRIGGRRHSWSFTLHGPTEFTDVDGHKLALKSRLADGVIATSDYVRARLGRLAPDASDRVQVIHCGIEPAQFTPSPRAGPSDRAVRILTVARLERRKGIHVLLEAFAELMRHGADAELTIVGDGPERMSLEQQARQLGLTDCLTFAGAVGGDEVAGYYREADVFCLPSFAEGVPTVLMEAMACELAVISTRVAGTPELVADGEAGLLVEPGDASALAASLTRVVEDPRERERLGAAGRRAVLSGYTLSDSAASIEAFLLEVSGGR